MLHAFIDESGDDGFAPTSSQWLVLGGYIMQESEMHSVKAQVAAGVGKIWHSSPPAHVHFVEAVHPKRKALLNLVQGINLTCSVAAAHKLSLNPNEIKHLKCPTLYCYLAKHLVERISWFARDRHEKCD